MKFLKEFWLAITFILAGLFLFSCDPVYAGPKEPPLSELRSWYPTSDGTVILEYHIVDKDGIQIWRFKHAQKATAERHPSCDEVVEKGDEIYLLTQEAKPNLYLIKKENDGSAPKFSLDFSYDLW